MPNSNSTIANNNFIYPDMQYHFRINRNVGLCKNKQTCLVEYYKKRERWIDTSENLTEEYISGISLLNYIHSYMFGGDDQNTYNCIMKPIIGMNEQIVIIDNDVKIDEDIWDCVEYYQQGFDSPDGDVENFTPEQTELQLKITDIINKIMANPNFQDIYYQSIILGEFTRT